jgi:predicted nicotinamide N-methyase
MKAGADRVLACDIDPFCRAAIALNAAANGVTIDSTIANLLDHPPPAVDLILAGDICYEKPLAERVLAWLAQGAASGSRILIGDPGRTYFPRTGLTQLAQYEVETTRELEDFEIKRTGVWTFPP